MEYVEVTGRSVDLAIEAALEELGLESRDQANIEVLEEGVKSFLGIGGKPAVVKVSRKPKRRRRRRRGSGGDEGRPKGERAERSKGGSKGGQSGGKKPQVQENRGRGEGRKPDSGGKSRPEGSRQKNERAPMKEATPVESEEDVQEQVRTVEEFLRGLVSSLGLEGEVTARVEDGLIKADVKGDQTEVLVGPKGSLIRVVQELARTVVQRKNPRPRRVIVDIAGYGARRREALAIYAQRLAESVLAEGGEIMLEAMNSADRKVVHDTIAAIEDIRSYSEGEEPRRSVVIAAVDGYVPPAKDEADEGDGEEE